MRQGTVQQMPVMQHLWMPTAIKCNPLHACPCNGNAFIHNTHYPEMLPGHEVGNCWYRLPLKTNPWPNVGNVPEHSAIDCTCERGFRKILSHTWCTQTQDSSLLHLGNRTEEWLWVSVPPPSSAWWASLAARGGERSFSQLILFQITGSSFWKIPMDVSVTNKWPD